MKAGGIFPVFFGLVQTIFTAVTFTTREKVVNIGRLTEKNISNHTEGVIL